MNNRPKKQSQSLLANKHYQLTSAKKITLVDLPEDANPIGCKWIFKKKYNPDGFVVNYKARLVAKGFIHKPNKFF